MASLDNKRHERFCQEYVVDYNGTQAAIRAGYKEKNARVQASALLTNPNILSRVHELQKDQLDRLALSQDYVVLQLLETYKCCREPTPVMRYDPSIGEMEETGMYQFDSKGALRALELIGKHLGMFGDKVHVSGSLNTGQLSNVLAQLRGDISG